MFFFVNETSTTEIYTYLHTLSLHDALPIYFLGDAEPRVLVCAPQNEAALGDIARKAGVGSVLTLGEDGDGSLVERSRGLDPDAPIVARAADDLAAILYNSGTTGRSKGAMLSHANPGSNTPTLRDTWGFTSTQKPRVGKEWARPG